MNWTQLKVTCKTEHLDTVCAVMSMLDNGLMIEDYRDIEENNINILYGELIDEALLKKDRTVAAVSLYIPETKNHNEYIAFIKDRLDVPYEYELIGLAEEDWANSWKQYYKPIKIGERIVIVPEWEDYSPLHGELIVKMDPGMAFGSGTHETTRLCIELIEKHIPANCNALDIGTGSGILAIIESLLGAKNVLACDIDPTAVKVARENAALNCVQNITFEVSDLLKNVTGLYDFASANIVADIIIRLAPDVRRYLKEDAIIVISGIICTQSDEVMKAMTENGFVFTDKLEENDWVAYVFKKINKKVQKKV